MQNNPLFRLFIAVFSQTRKTQRLFKHTISVAKNTGKQTSKNHNRHSMYKHNEQTETVEKQETTTDAKHRLIKIYRLPERKNKHNTLHNRTIQPFNSCFTPKYLNSPNILCQNNFKNPH
jgi:hypothetical protein